MGKIMLLGDVHGNHDWFIRCVKTAAHKGIETIIQVGDFGWWPHVWWGQAFIDTAIKVLREEGVRCWFLDGNHENFDDLWDPERPKDDRGFVPMSPNLSYIPRGTVFELAGATFLGLGGAYSIDKGRRNKNNDPFYKNERQAHSWWWQETLTDEDVDKAVAAVAGRQIDVMVSHDPPAGLDYDRNPHYKADWESKANRDRVRTVVEAAKPTSLFHGHMHNRHSSDLRLTDGAFVAVEGLACDGNPQSMYILEVQA